MQIHKEEITSILESEFGTRKRHRRPSLDRRLSRTRKNIKAALEAQLQPHLTLFGEALRFILAFEDYLFLDHSKKLRREFSLHVVRLRSDLIAIRELIFLGQETSVLALGRVFIEDLEIAMAMAIDETFSNLYTTAPSSDEFWKKYIGYGRIYSFVRRFLELGGGTKEKIESTLERHKTTKAFLSQHIHPDTSSAFRSAFPPDISRPGVLLVRPLGNIGTNIALVSLTIAEEIRVFSSCCVNIFSQLNPPAALADYSPKEDLSAAIESAVILDHLLTRHLNALWNESSNLQDVWLAGEGEIEA